MQATGPENGPVPSPRVFVGRPLAPVSEAPCRSNCPCRDESREHSPDASGAGRADGTLSARGLPRQPFCQKRVRKRQDQATIHPNVLGARRRCSRPGLAADEARTAMDDAGSEPSRLFNASRLARGLGVAEEFGAGWPELEQPQRPSVGLIDLRSIAVRASRSE